MQNCIMYGFLNFPVYMEPRIMILGFIHNGKLKGHSLTGQVPSNVIGTQSPQKVTYPATAGGMHDC